MKKKMFAVPVAICIQLEVEISVQVEGIQQTMCSRSGGEDNEGNLNTTLQQLPFFLHKY